MEDNNVDHDKDKVKLWEEKYVKGIKKTVTASSLLDYNERYRIQLAKITRPASFYCSVNTHTQYFSHAVDSNVNTRYCDWNLMTANAFSFSWKYVSSKKKCDINKTNLLMTGMFSFTFKPRFR